VQGKIDPRDSYKDRLRVNDKIRVKQIKVIGPDGKLWGVMQTDDALHKAAELQLDLVEIVPMEKPPICKIMDYGKYLYELKKKEREAKKHQIGTHLKEIRFTAHIGGNDYMVKLKHIREFLLEGNRVKVLLRFRGREITHSEMGEVLMRRVIEDTKDIGKPEFDPKFEEYSMVLQLVPTGKK
jgi:translation initiation factor IF-3